MNLKKIISGVAIAMLIVSCNKNETEEKTISQDDASVSAKIDMANDDVANIVDDQYENMNTNTFANKSIETPFSQCAVITRVPAFGTPLVAGDLVTKTIDFGTGCTLSNGNVVKGKIVITFTYQPTATSQTINYQFVNFYHNAIKLEGNKTFTRTMVAETATTLAHPIVVMNMDLYATFPNGNVYHRVGTRTREIIEGIGTPALLDNVYKITGSWTTTYPNATTMSSSITTPLHIKMNCMAVNKPLIVFGVITFVRNNTTATLDYGNGDCDNTAQFTVNGNSYTVVIGN